MTPFHIRRERLERGGFLYTLENTLTGKIICSAVSTHPIMAPQWLRSRQATLNTQTCLDSMGVY